MAHLPRAREVETLTCGGSGAGGAGVARPGRWGCGHRAWAVGRAGARLARRTAGLLLDVDRAGVGGAGQAVSGPGEGGGGGGGRGRSSRPQAGAPAAAAPAVAVAPNGLAAHPHGGQVERGFLWEVGAGGRRGLGGTRVGRAGQRGRPDRLSVYYDGGVLFVCGEGGGGSVTALVRGGRGSAAANAAPARVAPRFHHLPPRRAPVVHRVVPRAEQIEPGVVVRAVEAVDVVEHAVTGGRGREVELAAALLHPGVAHVVGGGAGGGDAGQLRPGVVQHQVRTAAAHHSCAGPAGNTRQPSMQHRDTNTTPTTYTCARLL